MVLSDDGRRYKLSTADRRTIMWNQTTSRRDRIPQYQNSLSLVDNRVHVCESCGQLFANLEHMKKHIELTHTGIKPVVCEICGKRFGTSEQMIAHYHKHREARLQEFAILKKRRQPDLVSESESESLKTVGSFHRVPKHLRSYNKSEPYQLSKSYGTDQTYNISKHNYRATKDDKLPLIHSGKGDDGRKDPNLVPTTQVGTLPMIKGASVNSSGKDVVSTSSSITLPRLGSRQTVPGPNPGHISVIDNVMGGTKAIETSDESGFVQNTEEELINSRMEAVSLAGRSPTPLSYRSRSASREPRKPKYLVNQEFWDTGSHVTEKHSGYTRGSGYNSNYRGDKSGSVKQRRKVTVSLPSIR